MKHPNKKQSLLLAALAVVALTLGGVCVAAEADEPAAPAAPPAAAMQQDDAKRKAEEMKRKAEEMRQKADKFMQDTKELRKEIFVAETALKALNKTEQPNVAAIQEQAGKLFELRDQLRNKARESGLPPRVAEGLINPPAAQGGHKHGHGHQHGPGMGHQHGHGGGHQHGGGGCNHGQGGGHQHGGGGCNHGQGGGHQHGHGGGGCNHGH